MSLLASLRDTLLPLALVLALAAVGFGGGVGGVSTELFWIVYAVMWFVSLVAITYWRRDPSTESAPGTDPVYVLQRRYAAGELNEAEFEAALDRLLGDSRLVRARERVSIAAEPITEFERN